LEVIGVKHKVLWRLQRLLEGKAQVRRRSLKVEVNELRRLLEIGIKVIWSHRKKSLKSF
jgi:hypothetical protein